MTIEEMKKSSYRGYYPVKVVSTGHRGKSHAGVEMDATLVELPEGLYEKYAYTLHDGPRKNLPGDTVYVHPLFILRLVK